MLDVVAVGMLNVDYIAGASSQRHRDPEAMREISDRFEHGAESVTDRATILDVVEQLGSRDAVIPTLGGSAFRVIQTLARLRLGLRLGCVGVWGRSPDPTLSALQRMRHLGIDCAHVRMDGERTSGMTVSCVQEGERTLLTWPGANEGFAGYVDEHADVLAAYLADARFVHVTAFLDPASPARLVDLIDEARRRNPHLQVSFDPGHAWCALRPPEAMRLLRLTDLLFLTYREFQALAGLGKLAPDDAAAMRILGLCRPACTAVVLKQYDRVRRYRLRDGELVRDGCALGPLDPDTVEDATGAGDVFAAGMLAALASDQAQLEVGTTLGMRMARHMVRDVGDRGHEAFERIARDVARGSDAESEPQRCPSGVFIAHGSSPLWRTVRDHLRDDLGLDVHHFEEAPHDSSEITTALGGYLRRCGFAVCVLTNEDLTAGGSRRARQNVVHEAGLFQGRYGFERVALLVEDDCELPSNLGGLVKHTFDGHHVEHAFASLLRHLLRERVLPARAPTLGR